MRDLPIPVSVVINLTRNNDDAGVDFEPCLRPNSFSRTFVTAHVAVVVSNDTLAPFRCVSVVGVQIMFLPVDTGVSVKPTVFPTYCSVGSDSSG